MRYIVIVDDHILAKLTGTLTEIVASIHTIRARAAAAPIDDEARLARPPARSYSRALPAALNAEKWIS